MEHTGTNNQQETVADTSQVDNSGYAGHNRQHSNPPILAMPNFDSRHFAKVLLQHARCVQHQGAASHAVAMDVAGQFEAPSTMCRLTSLSLLLSSASRAAILASAAARPAALLAS